MHILDRDRKARSTKHRRHMPLGIVLAMCVFAAGHASADQPTTQPAATPSPEPRLGQRPVVPAALMNPGWTDAMERAFWARGEIMARHFRGTKDPRTVGEGEKWSYPVQMLSYLAGDKQTAIGVLTAPDVDAGRDHAHTLGVDWYWSFTIKGQIRKFFQFAGVLPKEHIDQMRAAGKVWTQQDPRPNFELIMLMEHQDARLRDEAFRALAASKKMLEDNWSGEVGDQLRAWAVKAPPERAAKVGIIGDLVKKYAGQDFGRDVARWRGWWKEFADHDWMVLEEVERIMNIHTHPQHGFGRPGAIGADFSPASRGYWVDARNTDNLRAMRETSVYLMAEETGNELTRLIYKERLKRFVKACYDIGMGEWDSENYLAHTTMPYHNLFDFAKDPEVRQLAKAFLDWVYTAKALKYYRGGFGGPTKRDYGGANRVFGSGPAHSMWLMVGDCPVEPQKPHEDNVHALLSGYRPPAAVVALALRDFRRPVELLGTKPTYSNWFPGADEKPEFFETLFYGDSYYLGTCVSAGGTSDVGAFKLLAYSTARGADYFLVNSGKRLNSKNGGDQIGQFRNLCVFLSGKPVEYGYQIDATEPVTADSIWFVEMERTYLAVRPIAQGMPEKAPRGRPGSPTYTSRSTLGGTGVTGIALEVGDKSEHGSFENFRKAVVAKGKLTIEGDRVVLTGSDGRVLDVTYNRQTDFPTVVRDGKARDWTSEFDLIKPVDATGQLDPNGPVQQGWKSGTLTIRAGGQVFTQRVDENGRVDTQISEKK